MTEPRDIRQAGAWGHLMALAVFAVMVGVVAGVLALLNWAPTTLETLSAREFTSVEEAERTFGLVPVEVPAYFPEPLAWPPTRVLAQKAPYEAVVLEFSVVPQGVPRLVIARSASDGFRLAPGERLAEVRETGRVMLHDRVSATIESGPCADGSACGQIGWEGEGGYRYVVFMRAPGAELVRLAESMMR